MRVAGVGIQEFEKIRKNGQFYIDKSAFIARWYRGNDDITLITRPRRFGKTLTMDMLNCFFSTSYAGRADLFEGLAVSRDAEMMQLQGTIPAIKISLASVKAEDFDSFLLAVAGRIARLLRQYRYLLQGDALLEDEKDLFRKMSRTVPQIPDREKERNKYREFIYSLTHILQALSEWLTGYHGKKVYIFMDEYDTPVQAAYMHHYYDEAIAVMRELFSETLKENEYLDRAVITGITRIAKESLFSDMNNLAVSSVIAGGYEDVFGFTQEEMGEILKEYGLLARKDLVRFWYDGFTIGLKSGIYNPWSVINYLARKENPPEDYWAQSGGVGLIDRLVRHSGDGMKEDFAALLNGGVIEKDIREDLVFPMLDTDENAVWSLLIAAGYVRPARNMPDSIEDAGISAPSKTRLCLTNHESLLCMHYMVKGWFGTRTGNYMVEFADALLRDDLLEMNLKMQQVVMTCASSFDSGVKPSRGDVQPESFFHALALGMLTCLSEDFRVTSNRESGFGRYDVCMEPRDLDKTPFACLMEFKVFDNKEGDKSLEDTARRALRQIGEKAYDAELLGKGIPKNRIRRYGFGFRGKEVRILEEKP